MTVFDHEKKELVSCSCKNFNLHEDMAQLDYIFCDKTGTLTQNELIFKAFKILGRSNDETSKLGDEDILGSSERTARKNELINQTSVKNGFQEALELVRNADKPLESTAKKQESNRQLLSRP